MTKRKDIDNTIYPAKIANHIVKEQNKEIERLNNIINELEKDLEEVFNKMKEKQVGIGGRGYYYTDLLPIEDILDKLKELKEGK